MSKRDMQVFLVFLAFAVTFFFARGLKTSSFLIVGIIGFFFFIEYLFPAFPRQPVDKLMRWKVNLALTLTMGFTAGFVPFIASVLVYYDGLSLLYIARDLPTPLYLIISVLALDLLLYFYHFMTHQVPLFWRVHRIHHTDLAFDVSLTTRIHPLDALALGFARAAVVLLLGIDPLGYFAYVVFVVCVSYFIHANVYIPMWLDKLLRLVIVTPRMHYVHHSTKVKETNSNYSIGFSFWDKMFGTYREAPENGHEAMELGLKEFRDEKALGLKELLLLPFKDRYGR